MSAWMAWSKIHPFKRNSLNIDSVSSICLLLQKGPRELRKLQFLRPSWGGKKRTETERETILQSKKVNTWTLARKTWMKKNTSKSVKEITPSMDKFPIRVSIHCQHYVIYLGFYLYSVKLRQQYVANQLTSVILQYKQENKTKAQLY